MLARKVLRCDCGYEVRSSDDDVFVEAIRQHAREAHGIEFSVELALEVARHAQPASSDVEQLELDQSGTYGKEKQ